MVSTVTDLKSDISLLAHLMRRAGFGASRKDLEELLPLGYEKNVEILLNPQNNEPVDKFKFLRYYPMWWKPGTMGGAGQATWVWTMVNSNSPLQEKLCVFYHNILHFEFFLKQFSLLGVITSFQLLPEMYLI